jgi:Ring finger domain
MSECAICLEPIEEKQNVTKVHCCQQSFHTECYIKCGLAKNECPLCRQADFIKIEVPEQEQTRRIVILERNRFRFVPLFLAIIIVPIIVIKSWAYI